MNGRDRTSTAAIARIDAAQKAILLAGSGLIAILLSLAVSGALAGLISP